jgi:4-hydroxybenzoate polyprenyltransferase
MRLLWPILRGMSSKGPSFDVRRRVGESLVVSLIRAAHARQAWTTAVTIAVAAGLSGRGTGEVALVLVTVLVGQVVLGWHNDLVDRERDTRHDRTDKPLVRGTLDPGTLWFALACGVLLVIPLSVANGVVAGLSHLALLLVAALSNRGLLRRTAFSWVTWAASYALWPAFLAYGEYGGGWDVGPGTAPPTIAITAVAALLGIGVHFALALPGLVADNQDQVRHLPLLVARRTGAPRLLVVTIVYLVLVGSALVAVASTVGLRQ